MTVQRFGHSRCLACLAGGVALLAGVSLHVCPAAYAMYPAGGTAVPEIRFGMVAPPVVAQRDITVRVPTSNQQVDSKPIECSGMAWVDGQLILLSDRHGHVLFTCAVDLDAMTIGEPQPRVIIHNEQQLLEDAEALAAVRSKEGGWTLYAMCSLSNDPNELPLPKRRHMMRMTWNDAAPPTILGGGPVRAALSEEFTAVGVTPYRTFHAEFAGSDKNTYRWGNVEGLAAAPDDTHLLCGMRNPLYKGQALLFALRGAAQAFAAGDSRRMEVVDLFALDLGGRGISDLAWDEVTRGYLIAAAKSSGPRLSKDQPFPPNTLDSAIFWWSGRKSDPPVPVATVPEMKIEAICRLGDSPYIAIGSDESDVSEGRSTHAQSVVTILYFAGFRDPEAKRRP